MRHKWDFFIAHAGGDAKIAENLYSLLKARSKVFLDSKELNLGDAWDIKLVEAQRESLITIVIISPNTERAYYQREEIVVAIQMARNAGKRHRVIPVFMPGFDKETAPYGLNRIHSITLNNISDMDMACERLLETLERTRKKSRGNRKEEGHNSSSSVQEILSILNKIQETLNTQLILFDRERITPQDCDESIRILLEIKDLSIQFLINSTSKSITNQIMSLYKFDEEILNLVNLMHQFRNISFQINSQDTKQQIIETIQSLIKDTTIVVSKAKS